MPSPETASGRAGALARAADRPDLKIIREFGVPPWRVWQAWTTPGAMVRWLGPADWPAVEATADVRVGGAWRACLRARSGDELLWQSGRYVTVAPPHRLEFTFAWEGTNHEDGPGVETIVTIILEATASGGTLMRFTQGGFVSERSAAGHAEGWSSTFDRLGLYLNDLRPEGE